METPPAQVFGSPPACANCGGPFTPVIAGQTLCDRCQGLAHPEPENPLQQTEVAGYRLLRELGAGRFSHSWLAQSAEGRPAVVKLLRRYAPDPNAVQRFLAEAQRLAGLGELDHPHLARPGTAGVHLVSAFFLVYDSGGDLTLADELRERGRLNPARALELCAQVSDGLAVLHRHNVLHLDLKPANVGISRLDDGTEQAVVLDGVTAHLLAHIGVRDEAPLPLSSAAYLAPDEKPDERSDLYSVGVLLFQLLSGRLPFAAGPTADALLEAHRSHPPLRLRDVGRRVHPDLENLLSRLLAKDPAQRVHNGEELAVLMRAIAPVADAAPAEDGPEAVEDPMPVVAMPAEPPQMLVETDPGLVRAMLGEVPPEPKPPKGGLPRWWPIPAAVVAVGILVAIFAARTPQQEPPPRPPPPAAIESQPVPVPVPNPVPTPSPEPAAPPKKAPPPPSPNLKSFDRAQRAIWTNQPKVAQSLMTGLLKQPALSRRDRAHASRLMGDAEAKLGHKSKATTWYRKSFQLYDDPEERAKIARILQNSK